MGDERVRFGLCLPQFGATWTQAREVAQAADEGGFDSIWVVDHFVQIPDEAQPVLEAWTEVVAAAAVTRRVRIGQLVLCVSYRPPALLAKMAATLDQVSGGRLIVGLGAGWHQIEYTEYGYPFPPIGTRLAQLGEALEILRRMWSEERTTFDGKHFTVRDAESRRSERKRVVRTPPQGLRIASHVLDREQSRTGSQLRLLDDGPARPE